MWPRSDLWDETLTRGGDLLAYAEFLVDGDPAAATDPTGTDSTVPRLTAATVQVGEGVIRRQARLTISDDNQALIPVVDAGLIIPALCEIRLWAGLRYWNWTPGTFWSAVEYVPVFTGPITSYDLSNYPQVDLECSDRMWYVQRPFSVPFTLLNGTSLDDAILSILAAKVPPAKLEANIPITPINTVGIVYDEQADPADKVRELATSAGWTPYFDPMGTALALSEPELDPDAVVFQYREGPGGMLIRPALTGSAANIFNTWVVTGTAPNDTSAVPWAKVTDTDPTSPTFVRSSFDEMTRFINLPILTTDAQCRRAAQTYRRREGGVGDSLVAEVFPNAALEKGDVLRVTGGPVDRLIMADAFDLDLFGGPQRIAARAGTVETADG